MGRRGSKRKRGAREKPVRPWLEQGMLDATVRKMNIKMVNPDEAWEGEQTVKWIQLDENRIGEPFPPWANCRICALGKNRNKPVAVLGFDDNGAGYYYCAQHLPPTLAVLVSMRGME